MQRCIIVGGAPIENPAALTRHFHADDFCIYCDCGLRHMTALGFAPDLIVGDFDSHPNPHLAVETITLPREKDDTDTVFAVKEALARGFTDFLLVGMVGARLDHTLGNISILLLLENLGKRAILIDDYSEIEIVGGTPVSIDDSFAYFSLLSIGGTAKGITIKNAKYPLTDGEITCEYQYGISNEVLPHTTATVSVTTGKLLLVKVYRDK